MAIKLANALLVRDLYQAGLLTKDEARIELGIGAIASPHRFDVLEDRVSALESVRDQDDSYRREQAERGN